MSTTRTLSFPAETSLGQLLLVTENGPQWLEAQGEIEVPTDAYVSLEGVKGADLAPLDALEPDSLKTLRCRGVQPGGVGPITRQTGLESLTLHGELLTDTDIAELHPLGNLRDLTLRSNRLEGTNLGALPVPKNAIAIDSPAL